MNNSADLIINVEQLRVGLYIHLDLGWMDHPFTLSNFKLDDETQIQKIKSIGLKQLRYDPHRSDCLPLPPAQKNSLVEAVKADEPANPKAATVVETPSEADLKKAKLKQLQRAIDESEKKFVVASDMVKSINRNLLSAPKICIEQANSLINDMVETALMEGDIAIHALNGNRSSDTHFQHALNVTVLSLMLAKSVAMSKEDARLLGIASLIHDIGKAEISDKILLKKDALTHSEMMHYQQHAEYGARMIKDLKLPMRLGKLILQHHEYSDGSGYPAKLKGDQIDPLARILVLANAYDNLCNPVNPEQAKTPYEALASLFAKQRSKFDEDLLKRLIKSLGVYPPGSVVKLSDHRFATVVSVNPNQPLRPYVMVHTQDDRADALILDLREETMLNITHCIKPSQLPAETLQHMTPRKRVSYFLDRDPNQGSYA